MTDRQKWLLLCLAMVVVMALALYIGGWAAWQSMLSELDDPTPDAGSRGGGITPGDLTQGE